MGHAVFHIIFMDFLCSFHGNFMVEKCYENVLTHDLENPLKECWKCYGFTMKKY